MQKYIKLLQALLSKTIVRAWYNAWVALVGLLLAVFPVPAKECKKRLVQSIKSAVLILFIIGVFAIQWDPLWKMAQDTFRLRHAVAAEVTIDSNVNTGFAAFTASSPVMVFTGDQTGYIFYRDADNSLACVYNKTTDGGATWGTPVVVDSQGDCLKANIWYDRWTPGNTTGNLIHVLTVDSGNDDLWYTTVDTGNSDTLSTTVSISGTQGGTLAQNENFPSITRATDGDLYAGIIDDADAYVVRCTATCTTGSNWAEAGTSPFSSPALGTDPITLVPLASGNIMAIRRDVSANVVDSNVYTDSGSPAWAGSWTTIQSSAEEQPDAYYWTIGATVNKITNDIYLTYNDDVSAYGTDDDIKTAVYSGGSWTQKTDVLTNDSKGLTGATIALNENNGDVYVVYTGRTTAGTVATGNVYWKKSTDGMATWGSESAAVNSSADDMVGIFANYMSNERIFVAWREPNSTSADTLLGDTVADLTPPTYEQSAFRFFNNADSTDVGTTLAAQDTAATLGAAGDAFRLRKLLHVGADGAQKNLDNFKLQFVGKGTGTCAAPSGGTPSAYTDVTTSTVIAYKNNTTPADGATLTGNANDPAHSGHTNVNQTYEEANNFTNSVAAIPTGQDGKWDFALYDNGAATNTAYCFRIVKSDGTTINTYSQYPQITTAVSANSPPNSPSSLAQKKTDDTVLNTGDWTNQTSVKFTASVSDPDAVDTLQLCVEKDLLGTSFSNAEDLCGTGVAYSGTAVAVNVTITGITDASEYHWQARVKDALGNYSSWVSYGGNAESARDFGVDTTAPSGGAIYDGTNTGVDEDFNDGSLSSLSANWSGFDASASGLNKYQYSIGTTVGGTDIKTWTDNSTTTSVTATGLTLDTSKMYYFNVRAVDNAGNTQSPVITSDGQMVLPDLTFTLSSTSVSFAELSSSNSWTDTKTTTLTTSTNALGGYTIRAYNTSLLTAPAGFGSVTIPAFSGGTYASPAAWGSNTGFGFTTDDADVFPQSGACSGGGTAPCYAPFSLTGPGDIVGSRSTAITAGESIVITYKVSVSVTQAAAPYQTNIVYTSTPVY